MWSWIWQSSRIGCRGQGMMSSVLMMFNLASGHPTSPIVGNAELVLERMTWGLNQGVASHLSRDHWCCERHQLGLKTVSDLHPSANYSNCTGPSRFLSPTVLRDVIIRTPSQTTYTPPTHTHTHSTHTPHIHTCPLPLPSMPPAHTTFQGSRGFRKRSLGHKMFM